MGSFDERVVNILNFLFRSDFSEHPVQCTLKKKVEQGTKTVPETAYKLYKGL